MVLLCELTAGNAPESKHRQSTMAKEDKWDCNHLLLFCSGQVQVLKVHFRDTLLLLQLEIKVASGESGTSALAHSYSLFFMIAFHASQCYSCKFRDYLKPWCVFTFTHSGFIFHSSSAWMLFVHVLYVTQLLKRLNAILYKRCVMKPCIRVSSNHKLFSISLEMSEKHSPDK